MSDNVITPVIPQWTQSPRTIAAQKRLKELDAQQPVGVYVDPVTEQREAVRHNLASLEQHLLHQIGIAWALDYDILDEQAAISDLFEKLDKKLSTDPRFTKGDGDNA